MESSCPINRLSPYCLSNVFQFFDAKEMTKYTTVNKKFHSTSQIDYLWKALAQNESLFVTKRKGKTWKESYFRRVVNIDKNMRGARTNPETGKKTLQYEMCPIREHEAIIKQVDVIGNLVISLDEQGLIVLAFISFEDLEEYKKCRIEEFIDRKVICFQFDSNTNTLLVVSIDEESLILLVLYQVSIDEAKDDVSISSTLYSTKTSMIGDLKSIVNVFGNQVVISSDFRVGHPDEMNNTILIVDRRSGDVTKSITNDNDMADMMNVDDGQTANPIPLWDYFGTNIHQDSICLDQMYDRIFLSDFLCNIDVLDLVTQKFDTKICIKEFRNEDEKEERLSNNMGEAVFSITVKGSYIYVVTNVYLYVVRRHDLKVQASHRFNKQPIKVKFFPVTKNEKSLLSKDKDEVFISRIVFGFSDKTSLAWSCIYHTVKEEEEKDDNGNVRTVSTPHFKVATEGEMEKDFQQQNYHNYWRRPFFGVNHSRDNVHSVDVNNALAVCASKDLKVSVFDLDTASKYSITAGSKTVKSYKEHPQKPGVSEIKISDDKILLVLGNIMRVYSFDVDF